MHMKCLFHYRYINRKHPKFWLSKPIWALFSLMKKLSNLSYPKPSLMCYLFDMLIKPIMDYGSEIWNFAITDNDDNLEIIHRIGSVNLLWGYQLMLQIWQFMVSLDALLSQYAEKFRWLNIGRGYVMKMRIYLSIWEKHIYLQKIGKLNAVYKYYGHFQEFQLRSTKWVSHA